MLRVSNCIRDRVRPGASEGVPPSRTSDQESPEEEKVVVARRNDQQVSGDTRARAREREELFADTAGPRFSFWARPSLFRPAIFQILRAKRREYDCAVVANRFDRATLHRFLAERFLLRGLWLLVNVGMTPVVVAFETAGCRFAAQIAVDALIIYIECPRYVFGVFVCDIGHSFYGKSGVQH